MPLVAGTYAGVAINATQVMHANTIIGVGQQRGIPQKGIVIALMTAMVESRMGLVGMTRATDNDSLGLFQQRPSQGWGTPAQVMNSAYATNKFYDALLRVRGWEAMGYGAAAQAVQRSAFPAKYDQQRAVSEAMAKAAGVVGGPSFNFPGDTDGASTSFPTVNLGNFAAISDPAMWRRIGYFLLGCALLIVALFKLTGDNKLSPVTKAIGKAVITKKVKL